MIKLEAPYLSGCLLLKSCFVRRSLSDCVDLQRAAPERCSPVHFCVGQKMYQPHSLKVPRDATFTIYQLISYR